MAFISNQIFAGTPSLLAGTPSLSNGTPSLWIIFLFFTLSLHSQHHLSLSIHQEQNAHYAAYGEQPYIFYDSIHQFRLLPARQASDCQLKRIVYGYHPYWTGSSYLNYPWNLLSDLCYFSYEVNSSTGDPVSIHNWLTEPAIDSALQHGVRVHLCVTLFSGHNTFFANPTARQTLISNLISLLQQRNAHGINIDFEAVSSSQGDNLTGFIHDLSSQMKSAIPGSILSIAIPAVNWSNTFHIQDLNPAIDLFMVMGYDYYTNSSATAGPVTPLYSLTPSYDYSLSRTISAYQAEGIANDKFVLGIPYYGRQWQTQSNTVPSPILANGIALTYANIRNNGGVNYNQQNYVWEPNSLSSCYIFFQNNNWNQCFIGLDRDARKWYDMVNYRKLAGIGIWALGYDNGYTELWQAISDKLSDCYIPLSYDTLFDSGGPAWYYYHNEDYSMTIDHGFSDLRWLTFTEFNLEEPYDSLWLYAGSDINPTLLGTFTGIDPPGSFSSVNGVFTLRFRSDGLGNKPGWRAVYHDGTLEAKESSKTNDILLLIHPNPASESVNITSTGVNSISELLVYDVTGKQVYHREIKLKSLTENGIQINLSGWHAGVYHLLIVTNSGQLLAGRFVKF